MQSNWDAYQLFSTGPLLHAEPILVLAKAFTVLLPSSPCLGQTL